MKADSTDIICAAATPSGRAALSVIRVSGPGTISLVAQLMPVLSNINPDDARKLVHDFITDSNGDPIDEATAIPYFAPKSYTAEEMVEIIAHGGYMSAKAILSRLILVGARLAEPGEFTRRAFLNGRISLSEAEAVAAAIEAKSELALKAAARNLKGELYNKVEKIAGDVRELLAQLEAEIDFSEDEIDKTSLAIIQNELSNQLEKSERLLKSYDFGRGLNAGYKIAIVGRANVGKSSLLNALLNRDRAIVTDIPGTTRDTISEWIEFDGFPILLTDTAGLRESADIIESLGQKRTRGEIENADLVLFMIDSSSGVKSDDENLLQSIGNKPRLIILNKIDLKCANIGNKYFTDETPVPISAITGKGLDELKGRIVQFLHLDSFSLDTALLATERQYQAMKMAHDTLYQAKCEIESGQASEILSVYLRETLDHLGELVGETTNEDILNSIFSRFCIGK